MKVQFINNSEGYAQFVVLPIDEYRKLATSHIPVDTENSDDWQEIEVEESDNDNALIPHEVVSIMVDKQISLLSAWRHYRGLTQSQVAEQTGIKQANLSNMEKVDNTPHLSTLEKLAKVYNCEVAQLAD